MQTRKLFGTDGMRGKAGQYPLDRETVFKFGKAIGALVEKLDGAGQPQVVLGEDTRESGRHISRNLAAGIRSTGTRLLYAGVITTPGVAFLTRHHGFTAGIMVSASHNPYYDNGIKVFSNSGLKLSDAQELEIEQAIERDQAANGQPPQEDISPEPEFLQEYVGYLRGLLPAGLPLPKEPLVVDCANGSAARVVPLLLDALGIPAHILNAAPDGRNINLDCGSLHPDCMARETQAASACLGVALDGDADRAIFATSDGRITDGDHILYAAAPYYDRLQKLHGHAVVGTLMTNLALEHALARCGIGIKRTAVGDRYVLEEMLRSGYNLGGEPSGHIIFADLSLAGDGIITLLQMLRILGETGATFTAAVSGLKPYPQVIRNVPVREKPPLESIPEVTRTIEACGRELGNSGRIVVRYSGTEPLARVMVEAEDASAVEHHAARITRAIEAAIGAAAGTQAH
ncbi:MAG TPA: phosphoglucosamine mutase [Terriglobia bacterium]|nr:phosphoglucosamine mutase [Terriglobia bacterium]